MVASTTKMSEKEPENPGVSFCTACKNRLEFLKKTLRQNLKDNPPDYPWEIVVVDYNSRDGLHDWIKQNFQKEIQTKRLTYFQLIGNPPWRASHAKNIAHRLATYPVLCNLDADNFCGKNSALLLSKLVTKDTLAIAPLRKADVSGRIAIHRDLFKKLSGYDETIGAHETDGFYAYGFEDEDLVNRAKKTGALTVELPKEHLKALKHQNHLRFKDHASPIKTRAIKTLYSRHWDRLLAPNNLLRPYLEKLRHKHNRSYVRMQRNQDHPLQQKTYGHCHGILNFTEKIHLP
jgi:glycosyltransferase involved in cell wall biosynthesis